MDVFGFFGSSSMIWLLTYFLTGAYIGKYRTNYYGIKKIIFYSLCVIVYLTSTYIYFKLYLNKLYTGKLYLINTIISLLKQMFTDRYD